MTYVTHMIVAGFLLVGCDQTPPHQTSRLQNTVGGSHNTDGFALVDGRSYHPRGMTASRPPPGPTVRSMAPQGVPTAAPATESYDAPTPTKARGWRALRDKTGRWLLKITAHVSSYPVPHLRLQDPLIRLDPTSRSQVVDAMPRARGWRAAFNERIRLQGESLVAQRGSNPAHRPWVMPRLLPDALDDFVAYGETYNRHFQYALRPIATVDGKTVTAILFKEHTGGAWRVLKTPEGVDDWIDISADDQFLFAIDRRGQIFTMMRADESFDEDAPHWASRWGHPVWLGAGERLPPHLAWSGSHYSPLTQLVSPNPKRTAGPARPVPLSTRPTPARQPNMFDHSWAELDGRENFIGVGVTTIFALEPGGQSIRYLDPWLRSGDIRRILSPKRGQVPLINLRAKSSMVAGVGDDGKVYTRFFDVDISGANTVVNRYGPGTGHNRQVPLFNPEFDEDAWDEQPPLPRGADMTGNIDVRPYSSHGERYLIRVEGRFNGVNGFFYKDVESKQRTKSAWNFQPVDDDVPTERPFLTPKTLAPRPVPHTYNGVSASGGGWFLPGSARILAFNPYDGPALIQGIRWSGQPLEFWLHNIDPLRLKEFRPTPGLNAVPWRQTGYIQLSKRQAAKLLAEEAAGSTETRDYLSQFERGPQDTFFLKVKLSITQQELHITPTGNSTRVDLRFALEPGAMRLFPPRP